MNEANQLLEQRKAAALKAAREEGIVDIVRASTDGISLELLELATKLMKENGPYIYSKLAERRNQG